MKDIIVALVAGFLFGWSLHKAGLTKYHKIVNVFRLTDLTVLKYMLAAMAFAMVGVYVLMDLHILAMPNINATYIAGNIIGGLVFGVGMAAAGF